MNTRALNHLAGVICRAQERDRTPMGIAFAVDAAGMLMSPEVAAELERLRVRVAELEAERHSTNEALSDAMVERSADRLSRLLAPTQALREAEPADEQPPLTVFRASHDSIVLGYYATRQAAYEHCEAYEMRDDPVFPMSWKVDEDGVAELVRMRLPRSPGAESATGYVVTPVEVASEYDEGADE